ncbi:hypothetical protein AGMMS50268_21170 [Spirochaetia bacterium]|nr:hypothetical protein AGMMS50268_21170 [Spirochaetia bacterium]
MNMDRSLVNRSLLDVGQHPLTDTDIEWKNENFQLCKDFYLQTFLEALSEVSWTGGRKRDKLVRTGRPHVKSSFRFMYDMPFDCARPIELQGNGYYVVEDRFICTDVKRAELLYITNGKILRQIAIVTAGRPGDLHDMEYLTAGAPWTEPDVTLRAGRPADITDDLPVDPVIDEDYPDYRPPEYEPKFYEYVEKTLAAKFAMKLSNNPALRTQMLQEALLIRQEAVTASMGSAAARQNPQKWWKEELGL